MRVLGSRGRLLGIFDIHDWVYFKCTTRIKSRKEMTLGHQVRGEANNLNRSDGQCLKGNSCLAAQRIEFLFLHRDTNIVATREDPSANSQALPGPWNVRCRPLTRLNELHVLLGPMVDEVHPLDKVHDSIMEMAKPRELCLRLELACDTPFLWQTM